MTTWPTFEPSPPVAFLDVDGTLLAETTSYLYAKLLRRRGMLDRSLMLRAAIYGLRHKLGRLDYGSLLDYGFRLIRDIPLVELERASYENFKDQVRPRLYEGVVEHLNGLRGGGTKLVLVSSSPEAVIAPLGIYLGCDDLLTTPIRVEGGRIAGRGAGPPCYGEGKRYWASRWSEDRGIDMDAAAAYADNWSDRALLEGVGHPIVVRPGRKLRNLAIGRGWTIVNPRRPRVGGAGY